VLQRNPQNVPTLCFCSGCHSRCFARSCPLPHLPGQDQGRLPGGRPVSSCRGPGTHAAHLLDRRRIALCRCGERLQEWFAALWQPAGGWLGLLLIYFIAPRARKFAQFTLPDLLEARYNQTARVLGTIAILIAYVAITSYQFRGGGDVLHLIFPDTVTPELGTFLIAAFVILTTAMAGMSSVAYMDVAIGSLVTVICVIAAPMLFFKAGGWAACTPRCPPIL